MNRDPCDEPMVWDQCKVCYEEANGVNIKNNLDAPVPWIGVYIALASAICAIAMTSDVFKGFKSKKFWFPCKYFSLNATSSTLLTVAMKLPMDLTNLKLGVNDTIADISGPLLMTTAIGNFMTSVASTVDNGIVLNLTALGILVITITINICIFSFQISDVLDGDVFWGEQLWIIISMLLLLVLLCYSATVVPTTKRYIELNFQEMHKMVSNERGEGGKITLRELTTTLKKFWVMTETGSPQFVMARSVICVMPGVMCLLNTLILVEVYVKMSTFTGFFESYSSYKWSVNCIMFIQTGAVVVGTIAPISRWFIASQFKSTMIGRRKFKEEMETEAYWTQRLVEWRESPIPLRIRDLKFKKALHVSKRLLLYVCIKIQILIILASKIILIFSAWCIRLAFLSLKNIKKQKIFRPSNHMRELELESESDFSSCVLLLEGEPKLPSKTTANICNEVDNIIQVGRTQKPTNIIKLLHMSKNFNGVREFDSSEVTSLHSQQPPNCWSLSLITLTSIAIALPNIPKNSVNQLLSGVSEGLSFVKLIEKAFDSNGELVSIKKAADIVWVGLELNHKWLDKELKDQTSKDTLQELSNMAKKIVMDFMTNATNFLMQNPLHWPVKVIAANSMYRICETSLLFYKDSTDDETGEMFERLSIIISDILAACLTNLARAIILICKSNPIEKRQDNIRQAAVLLGESEEVIQFIQQREWPNLAPEKAGYIEAWRAILEQENKNQVTFVSATNDDGSLPQTLNGHVAIDLES